ncbi:hypothetical protein N0V91_005514 [Didymella pomorum]|uniref:Uncharacterized protein n=1 Tax=Didymella pomorum TaxID=749634 RepID=A0A9W8ZGS3_9PLEO|nr:hypothetical protein N0V91_005514 [Didymella pomorum]
MATRRSNRRRIDEPAAESTQDASAPATPAPNKRQRVSTRPFEQGVNPITPPSTVRRPSQRPSGSQRSDTEALFVREDSEVRGEDSDDSEQDDEADPCPEVDADTEDLAAAGEGAATEALAAVDSSIDGFSEEEHEVVATVRYRASYGDIEKNPIHSAADTFAECKVDRLSMQCIWQWVDEVIASQVNQRVNVQLASLSAELWHGKGTNKRDRPVKRLRRESLFDVRQLKDLARSIDVNTSERLCMDFNLYLTGDPITASQGVAPSPLRLSQVRARMATVIQEEALEGVVAANLMGQGATLAVRDTWRCEDKECNNWPWTCWRPRSGLPDESHYPVNPNIIAMWAKAVEQRQCTVSEPNDRIKSAIMRARERSEIDKHNGGGGCGGGGVLDEVRELQKSVLMAQLQQLTGGLAAKQPTGWVPFEYEFWAEIMAHTDNFLEYFTAKWDVEGAEEGI